MSTVTGVQYDPDAMRATQPKFAALADTVKTALADLRRVIEAEGECWGSDETGQAFAKNYTPGVTEGTANIEKFAGAVTAFGDKIVTAANTLQQSEQSHTDSVNQVQA
ncbi:WXG100 family type VII secretion target [Nocardia wallacei]|uniref:WXG100 family type VII secretion target n=1 Tax=Nocardia wallacei TaxID=480035 RepID=UPI002458E694|nr:WXG100 family type VII secretion target [Nocardia wallacei]